MKRKLTLLILAFLLLNVAITAQQPTPHGVAGRIFNHDGTKQVDRYTNFQVNDTISYDYVKGLTGPPGGNGRYSVAIDGNDGDIVTVLGWNNTHFGNHTLILSGDMDDRDFNLSVLRPSEINISIYHPDNNSRFNLSQIFNVLANITLIGGTAGSSCNFEINFSEASNIFGFITPRTVSISTMAIGSKHLANWTVLSNFTGVTNITAKGSCSSDGMNFDGVSTFSLLNISVVDTTPPNVTLIFPLNNTLNQTHHNITFFFNATEFSVFNCSLILNEKINSTLISAINGTRQNFTAYLPSGQYNWTVNCTDSSGNVGTTPFFNLTIDVPTLTIFAMKATSPISLIAGTTFITWCNASVIGASNFNATLIHSSSNQLFADDNNTHYTNTSCIFSELGNYSCSFNLLYHANNGSWNCNFTASSYEAVNWSNITTNVDTLSAIEILPDLIEYGNVNSGNISSLIPVNISNMGNVLLNLDLFAYGAFINDSLALNCTLGNLTYENQKVSTNSSLNFDAMINVSGSTTIPTMLSLGLQKRITTPSYNTTFWRLNIPPGPQRNCSGTVVFTAILS